jgi:hypothetical protein
MTDTTEPTQIRVGDTLEWTKSLSDYPATLWTLKYAFRNASNSFDITASADGTDHSVSVAAATTSAYVAGEYTWVGYVLDIATGLERHTVSSGNATVNPDLAVAGAVDGRTYAKRTLDAIQAVIENRASIDQQSYTIHDRQLSRMSVDDLFRFREQFKGEVAAEEAAQSGVSAKRISTVF